LTKIRSVSRGFRSAVDCLPQYKSIRTHAPNSIRAALTLRVPPFFSCRDLYIELTLDCCSSCNMFGRFLYLPTCSRVCYECFTNKKEYLVLRQDHCQLLYDISANDLNDPQVVKALSPPGRFGPGDSTGPAFRNRVSIIHMLQVQKQVEKPMGATL